MAKCKGCGRDIIWIKTGAGKSMPLDPEPVMYWEKSKAKGKVVTPNGELLSCVFEGDPEKATGIGYVSHWATCPSAGDFKKNRRADG